MGGSYLFRTKEAPSKDLALCVKSAFFGALLGWKIDSCSSFLEASERMCVCAGGKIDGKLGAALPRGNVIVPVHGANARREFFLTACNVAHEGRKARGVGVFFRLFQQNFRGWRGENE